MYDNNFENNNFSFSSNNMKIDSNINFQNNEKNDEFKIINNKEINLPESQKITKKINYEMINKIKQYENKNLEDLLLPLATYQNSEYKNLTKTIFCLNKICNFFSQENFCPFKTTKIEWTFQPKIGEPKFDFNEDLLNKLINKIKILLKIGEVGDLFLAGKEIYKDDDDYISILKSLIFNPFGLGIIGDASINDRIRYLENENKDLKKIEDETSEIKDLIFILCDLCVNIKNPLKNNF